MTGSIEALRAFLRLEPRHEEALRRMSPLDPAQVERMVDEFYARILADADARGVLADTAQVDRLKGSLRVWTQQLLSGPYDAQYHALRRRIGYRHVEVGLPQRFMPLAMNVIREHLRRVAWERLQDDPAAQLVALEAIGKVLDLELTIMLETYHEASLARIRQTERLATIGQLAASIGHELKNPLGVVNTSAALIERLFAGSPPPLAERARPLLERLGRATRQASDLGNQLVDFARVKTPNVQTFATRALLDEAYGMVAAEKPPHVTIELTADDDAMSGDPSDLARALANLLRNALQAMGDSGRGSRIQVRVHHRDDQVDIEVEDDGPGVQPAIADRIFEPLFTTRSRGAGLGLAICRSLVEAHGGTLALEATEGQGARFVLRLPQNPPQRTS